MARVPGARLLAGRRRSARRHPCGSRPALYYTRSRWRVRAA
ncbi:hypothetical protein ACFSM7_11005 [Clavibacter michiganensis subsp. tessellarius]